MSPEISLEALRRMDAADPLHSFRDRFELPAGIVYLDGNSLGALPRQPPGRVAELIRSQWGKDLVKSWLVHGWMSAPTRVGDKIARLLGAAEGEVIVADSTSVNLYKCLSAALQLTPARRVILAEPGDFPTDLYVIQGLCAASGGEIELRLAQHERMLESIDADVGVVAVTHVHYKSAHMYEMAALTRRAHESGATVIWDLSHSAGAVELDLNAADVDFAVGCGYKYLNGGPGAPAYLFVARRHQESVRSPLTGWLGHIRPFDFVDEYQPANGIARFFCGTHPMLGIAALESAIDVMLEADRALMWIKSRRLCELFIQLAIERCGPFGIELVSLLEPEWRGSHVAFRHPRGLAVIENLVARGVIADFRTPDVIRFGFAPLYVSYEDVWLAVEVLRDILQTRSWDRPEYRVRRASG
jgi:kynureninase